MGVLFQVSQTEAGGGTGVEGHGGKIFWSTRESGPETCPTRETILVEEGKSELYVYGRGSFGRDWWGCDPVDRVLSFFVFPFRRTTNGRLTGEVRPRPRGRTIPSRQTVTGIDGAGPDRRPQKDVSLIFSTPYSLVLVGQDRPHRGGDGWRRGVVPLSVSTRLNLPGSSMHFSGGLHVEPSFPSFFLSFFVCFSRLLPLHIVPFDLNIGQP